MAQLDDAKQFGARLEEARIAAGRPSYRALEREALAEIGPTSVSNQTISNYHHGKVPPETAQMELVCFLAKRYGVKLGDLSPTIAARWKMARELVDAVSGCISDFLVGAPAA